jgi:hypothetical protein
MQLFKDFDATKRSQPPQLPPLPPSLSPSFYSAAPKTLPLEGGGADAGAGGAGAGASAAFFFFGPVGGDDEGERWRAE